MSSKETKLYEEVFKVLKYNHGFEPSNIMLDFEAASRKAAKSVFDESSIRGCWFHFEQSIYRKARKLGLVKENIESHEIDIIIKLFQNLPLLPTDKIEEGFSSIKSYQHDLEVSEAFEEFNEYFQMFWLDVITPLGFGVSELKFRTNNFNEGYNSKIKGIITKQLNVYQFLNEMIVFMHEAVNDFYYDKKHNATIKSKSKVSPKLEKALAKLLSGEYTVFNFLLKMSGYRV